RVAGVGYAASGTIGSGTRPDDMRTRHRAFFEWQPRTVEQLHARRWTPRFGFAYQARRHTVIRGGFGIFYNTQGNRSALFRLHRQLPFGPNYSATVDQFSAAPARVQDGLPPIPPVDTASVIANPSGNFNVVTPHYKTGYAEQGNYGIELEIL